MLIAIKTLKELFDKAKPRQGWDKAFKQMHESGDDQLLLPDVFQDENFDEWK